VNASAVEYRVPPQSNAVAIGGAATCAIGAVVLAYAGAPPGVYLSLLAVAGFVACALPIEYSILAYVALLGVDVFAPGGSLRVCVGDVFMASAGMRVFVARRFSLPQTTLVAPVSIFLVALAISNIVGLVTLRSVSEFVLLNKDLGALYLALTVFTLCWIVNGREIIERTIRWFIAGVSVANVTSLLGAVLAFAGFRNALYLMGNMRLYGWTLNPNLFGSVLLTAALLELGLLSGQNSARATTVRWVNLHLLGLAIVLTLSRGSWLAVAVGSFVLLAFRLVAARSPELNARRVAIVGAWVVAWGAALGSLAVAGAMSTSGERGADYAERLRSRFAEECRANPSRDACADVTVAGTAATAPQAALPEFLPDPSGNGDLNTAGTQLTSSRGVDDRLAILKVAASDYTASVGSMMLGTGLDTFRARSAPRFGLPLIIHNTFAWSLFEMGLLGFGAVLWLWMRTAGNLVRAWRAGDWRTDVAAGLLAALAGLTIFCLLNDGMYERHLWLVFVLADRLVAPDSVDARTQT
jgi:hypothetical protein